MRLARKPPGLLLACVLALVPARTTAAFVAAPCLQWRSTTGLEWGRLCLPEASGVPSAPGARRAHAEVWGAAGPVARQGTGRRQRRHVNERFPESVLLTVRSRMDSAGAQVRSFRERSANALRFGQVRYFAFGSNMSPAVFREMRGMRPRREEAAWVPGYRLAFNLRGLPGVEPAFASAEPSAHDDELHGVIYTISRSEWARLAASEGVGAAYDVCEVTCQTYSGETLGAVTLSTRAGPLRAPRDVAPSQAYLNILIEGAQRAGLRAEYIERLQSVRAAGVGLARGVGPFNVEKSVSSLVRAEAS